MTSPMTNSERSQKWRDAHREEAREYQRLYMRERRKDPAEREKEAVLRRRWYVANAERERKNTRLWSEANPEKRCDYTRKRRALEVSAAGAFTPAEFSALCDALDHRCFYCGEAKPLHADHNIPLTRGGSNDLDNILPACKSCNSRKRTRTAAEFLTLIEKETAWRR